MHHLHKHWISPSREAERLAFGSLVWDLLLILVLIECFLLLGTLIISVLPHYLAHNLSNARGAGQNGGASGKAASGKVYLSTLEQAACNFAVNPSNGLLTQQDYFEPYGYDSNNGGDIDFGSSGIALLDPGTFYGTGVSRIGVAGGKDGLVYILNADNLGGFAGGQSSYLPVFKDLYTD